MSFFDENYENTFKITAPEVLFSLRHIWIAHWHHILDTVIDLGLLNFGWHTFRVKFTV